MKEEMINYL